MRIGAFTILLFMVGLFIGGAIIYFTWVDDETKKIDCFDRYGNKILNQVCLDGPPTDNEKFAILVLTFMMVVLFTLFGLMCDNPLYSRGFNK